MESDWRLGVWNVGWSGSYEGVYPWPFRITKVARLITPFFTGGLQVNWLVESDGSTGRFMHYGYQFTGLPEQMAGLFLNLGSDPFPGIYAVHPD